MIEQINFQIKKTKESEDTGHFVLEPLEPGYGHTLGNALRRVLLTSLAGAAITQVKINGVRHKFSTINGLKEDVIELILNLKQVRIKYKGEKPVKLHLEVNGPGEIKAGKITAPAQLQIVNPELVLAHLADKKSKLKIEMLASSGFGYSPAEERKTNKLGAIPLDASFGPVRRVNYSVEATRVGGQTDWDKLNLEIVTNGTIKPSEALKEAALILTAFFSQIVEPKKAIVKKKKEITPLGEVMRLSIEELELPTRIINALRKAGYETASDLATSKALDLAKIRNLGEKSIKIIQAALVKKGVL